MTRCQESGAGMRCQTMSETWIQSFRETLCGDGGTEHAEVGDKRGAFDRGGVVRLAMFKGDRPVAHAQDPLGKRDRLVDVVCHEENAGPMVGDELADKVMHAASRQRIESRERFGPHYDP